MASAVLSASPFCHYQFDAMLFSQLPCPCSPFHPPALYLNKPPHLTSHRPLPFPSFLAFPFLSFLYFFTSIFFFPFTWSPPFPTPTSALPPSPSFFVVTRTPGVTRGIPNAQTTHPPFTSPALSLSFKRYILRFPNSFLENTYLDQLHPYLYAHSPTIHIVGTPSKTELLETLTLNPTPPPSPLVAALPLRVSPPDRTLKNFQHHVVSQSLRGHTPSKIAMRAFASSRLFALFGKATPKANLFRSSFDLEFHFYFL